MGIIKPPWISDEWFKQCPFNYCDHFGDKEKLSLVCRICREEEAHIQRCKEQGIDPYDPRVVLKVVDQNFKKAMRLIENDAKRLGIDLTDMPEEPERKEKDIMSLKIYKLAEKYGNHVHQIINYIGKHAFSLNDDIMVKTIDALSHSRFYVNAKIYRALGSAQEELDDPDDDLFDSKTSAFLAYIAVERNVRAILFLTRSMKASPLKRRLLEFADISVEFAELIRHGFFALDDLVYEEFGAEEY